MKVSDHFSLEELVDPWFLTQRGNRAIELLDMRLVNCLEHLRTYTGPLIINGAMNGHIYTESGLRRFDTKTGATFSQHKYGRAVDVKSQTLTPEQIRNIIRQHWPEFKALGLSTIEKDTPSWCHFDTRWTGFEYLYEVPYK